MLDQQAQLNGTILVVDDDESVRRQLYWALNSDFRVLEASSRAAAVELLQSEQIDVVVSDLHLPPHETDITEGLAIVAPMARNKKLAIAKLILMGLIAGVPTIIGSWIGGFLYSPIATIIFLGIGAGAIFQVVYSVGSWMYYNNNRALTSFPIVSGFMLGIFIMYITGLLI